MIPQTKWTERTFDFSFHHGLFPNILERLRGTPARLEEMVSNVTQSLLTQREGSSWSIQEHIGHLIDLETLHEGRIDDFIAGKEKLRPADMTNQKTWEADHNNKSIRMLLNTLRSTRMVFVTRLEEAEPEVVTRMALHPRLNQRMRLVDMAYFVAEHDDQHLAIITRLIRNSRS